MLFFVAALTKTGWLLKRACGSTAPLWVVSALTFLCPSLPVLSALTPKVKMPNACKDLAASADFMVPFLCFQRFLVGLDLPQQTQ